MAGAGVQATIFCCLSKRGPGLDDLVTGLSFACFAISTVRPVMADNSMAARHVGLTLYVGTVAAATRTIKSALSNSVKKGSMRSLSDFFKLVKN